MLKKESLCDLIARLEARNNLVHKDVTIFKELDEITIIRTAGVHLFEKLLVTIRKINPLAKINVLMKENNLSSLQAKYSNIEIFIYPFEGNFDSEKLNEMIQKYAYKNLIIMYQNLWGTDYSNIESAVLNTNRDVYFWNKNCQILQSKDLKTKIMNDEFLSHLIEWYSFYRENGGRIQ